MSNEQHRQGDVIMERIDTIPEGLANHPREGGRLILAHGEVTGHAHAITEQQFAHMWTNGKTDTVDEELFLKADVPLKVTHEEHGTIELGMGNWKITRQKEYSAEAIRRVAD